MTAAVGRTPLVALDRIGRGVTPRLVAKLEHLNPGGSVKDRIALPMIEAAERAGLLKPGGVIIEPTSGNTGVGLAQAAAVKGYRCIFVMADKQSEEKRALLRAYGAEVVICPTDVDPDDERSYYRVSDRLAREMPGAWKPDQYANQANPEAHYATTGPELWEQTEGRITHFVAAAGTGGTITGVGRYLKERNPKIKIIAGDPQGSILAELWRSKGAHRPDGAPYKVEGIGQDKLPGTLDLAIVDDYRTVSDRDAFAMTRRLTREEGLFVGGSAGLITHVALQVAREVDDAEALIVTFLCDTGERYLSKVFNDEWMRENQLLEPDRVTLGDLLQHKGDAAPSTLVSAAPGQLVRQALGLMRLHDVSQLPVLENGECVGSVTEYALTQRGLESSRFLDAVVGEVMDEAFPVVDAGQHVESVQKLLSKATPAVLVRRAGTIEGIVTRSDMLAYLMSR